MEHCGEDDVKLLMNYTELTRYVATQLSKYVVMCDGADETKEQM